MVNGFRYLEVPPQLYVSCSVSQAVSVAIIYLHNIGYEFQNESKVKRHIKKVFVIVFYVCGKIKEGA